jgi:hypothetical protein
MRNRLCRDSNGAVFVEFLIAFLPVFTFFLCLVQLGLLFAVRLVTEHAATTGARAAAVVIGDDPKRYGNEPQNKIEPGKGKRYDAVYRAVLLTLAPFVMDGTIHGVTVEFPPPDQPEGKASSGAVSYAPMDHTNISKVRVRVTVDANCKIGLGSWIACEYRWARLGIHPPHFPVINPYPTRSVAAEGMFPYQGASYAYP